MTLIDTSLIKRAVAETLSAGKASKSKGTKHPLVEKFCILLREYITPLCFITLEKQCRDPYPVGCLSTADYSTLAGEDRHQIVPFLPHFISRS